MKHCDLDLINEKNVTWNTYTAFKNTTFDQCRQKFTKKEREPQKDGKFEKWNLEGIDDSPFSLFSPLWKAKTLLSWQMNTVVTEAY